MKSRNLIVGAAAMAAAAFFAPVAGTSASAASLGPQTGLAADGGSMTLAEKADHHHRRWPYIVGGAVVLGLGYCAVQADQCAEAYGTYNYWYRRCMRRAGCY
jgi:hypothetical protein